MPDIRPLHETDIPSVIDLLEPYVQEGIVLRREPEAIRAELSCFFAAYSDGDLIGIVSYHDYDNHLYEIRSLVVRKDNARSGIGRALVSHTLSILRARDAGARIFALTYVPGFFRKLGFEQLDKSLLPEKIWKDCSNCPKKECCTEIPMIYRG